MKAVIIPLSMLLVLAACAAPTVTTFEECVQAGNPVMESYPRQCQHNDQTFVEEVETPIDMPAEAQLCPDERSQAVTREYVPVIASDGNEYDNWRQACANKEVMWYTQILPDPALGGEETLSSPEPVTCTQEQRQADICTMEYRPMCGLVPNNIQCVTAPCPTVDAVDFSNGCQACAGQSDVYYEGACADQKFVVCQPTVTGFSAEEFAKNIGGICVDVCPANMDGYMTQIGVEMCIKHYGEEEIAQWDVCTESSDSCNCVKAYETTDGQEIADADYRCVPEQYGERMLFRAGMDRLDEDGQQSVMIA